jgi:hypothetical protein
VEPNEAERERYKVRPFVEDGDDHVAIMQMMHVMSFLCGWKDCPGETLDERYMPRVWHVLSTNLRDMMRIIVTMGYHSGGEHSE